MHPEIPVAPGEEHWLLGTSLDEVYWEDYENARIALKELGLKRQRKSV